MNHGPSRTRSRRLPTAQQLQVEGVLLAGGLRALLLQLAHPAVGHGVARHSAFATDPLRRLLGTLEFVYVVGEGDPDLVRSTARAVGRLHRPVVGGGAGNDGAPGYDARDPHLQFWVAATIHDTALRIAEAVWGRLPDALADELLARNGRIATVLGLPAHDWPISREAFDRAFAATAAELGFDAVTLDVVRTLVAASAAPWWVRLLMPGLVAATVPTLPALRADLDPLVHHRLRGLLPIARRAAPLWRILPPRLRRLPATRILARVHRGAAAEPLHRGARSAPART